MSVIKITINHKENDNVKSLEIHTKCSGMDKFIAAMALLDDLSEKLKDRDTSLINLISNMYNYANNYVCGNVDEKESSEPAKTE